MATTGVNQDREEAMCWGNAYGNPRIHEEPRESSRKGDISTSTGHTSLQGRTHRERTLEANRNGQVGYASAAFLVVIPDMTAEEEESGATKKGQEDSIEENRIGGWIGQEGERMKSYSAAVIDGIKRNSRIYVGDSFISEDRLKIEQGGGRSSLFTGSKNRACDRESRTDHGKRKWRVHSGTLRDEQRGQGRNNNDT